MEGSSGQTVLRLIILSTKDEVFEVMFPERGDFQTSKSIRVSAIFAFVIFFGHPNPTFKQMR
jgi:hypothetical protein